MNSEERRAARRKRREEKRAAKRAERVRNCTLERIADPNALYIAAKQCGRNVKWKASIQTYLVHILRNITKARADILNGVDFCRPTNDFVIYEQGVRREISAVKIYERVIKKSYCQNALVPAVVPTLIANNYANVKGRGTLYAIHTSKEHLQTVLGCIEALCAARGMRLNTKKTHIVKLSRGFTFLKKRFFYSETGKVVVKPCRSSITKMRRKLKAMAKLVGRGAMTEEQAYAAYQSWRGSMKHIDAQKTVESMDALYRELFHPVNTFRGGGSH